MKLSIIVPVYNTEAYVAKCLDSLIEPDLGGYEIIAVNDGSTDSSGEVVRRYEERYPDLQPCQKRGDRCFQSGLSAVYRQR